MFFIGHHIQPKELETLAGLAARVTTATTSPNLSTLIGTNKKLETQQQPSNHKYYQKFQMQIL